MRLCLICERKPAREQPPIPFYCHNCHEVLLRLPQMLHSATARLFLSSLVTEATRYERCVSSIAKQEVAHEKQQ